jgi:hypothetical protein
VNKETQRITPVDLIYIQELDKEEGVEQQFVEGQEGA